MAAGGELMRMVGVMVLVRRRDSLRWRQSPWKNVHTQRTKPVGRRVIRIIVSRAWPAYQACEGMGVLSAEGNAALVVRHGDGMGRGDGHGI